MTDLIQALRRSARQYPDHAAIITDQGIITHQQFNGLSDQIAGALVAQGISPKDRIALYCPNGPEFPIVYAGILKAGATVVPINLLINTDEISFILKDCGARGLFYHDSLQTTVLRLMEDHAELDLYRIGDGSSLGPNQRNNLEGLLAMKEPPPEISLQPEHDLAAILYTSGTTGFPKGAMLTHRNLTSNCKSVHAAMHWRSGMDVVLVVLPMFHAFASTVGMLTPLTNGCALVPLARFDPDTVAHMIDTHQATIFLGVPSMYSVLLRLKDDRVTLLKSLRFAIAGGAAMPVSVLHQFQTRFNIRIYEGDGPTECSPVTCVNPIDGISKPGTVGLPVPDVEMKIVDDDGLELSDGEVGEIAVRGPNVMKGYWNQPDATAAVFMGDWLLTGDLGTRDEDGYFSIVDRKKDLIIVNGMNVYPRMIEEVLYRFPNLKEAAVIAEPSELHGEIPIAFVVLDPVPRELDRQLRAFCREHLGRHQVPKRFITVEELPKNAAGKIMKRELRKQGEIERGIVGL